MKNFEQEHHAMIMVNETDDGEHELLCPICGRNVRVRWAPEFELTVIEPGDPDAIHSGSAGGLRMGAPEMAQSEAPITEDAARLEQWEQMLVEMNFADLWDQEGS